MSVPTVPSVPAVPGNAPRERPFPVPGVPAGTGGYGGDFDRARDTHAGEGIHSWPTNRHAPRGAETGVLVASSRTCAGTREGLPMSARLFQALPSLLEEPPESACRALLGDLYAVMTRPRGAGRARATVEAASAILRHLQGTDSREPRRHDVQRLMKAAARVERALARERRVRGHARRRATDLASRPHKADLPRCGARCRSKGGAPCDARVAVRVVATQGKVRRLLSDRCRMHGGLSTGPRTADGRQRCVEAGRQGATERWRRYREGRGAR